MCDFLEVGAGDFTVKGIEGAVLAEAVGVAGEDAVGVGIIGGSGEVAEGVFRDSFVCPHAMHAKNGNARRLTAPASRSPKDRP